MFFCDILLQWTNFNLDLGLPTFVTFVYVRYKLSFSRIGSIEPTKVATIGKFGI